MTKEINHYQDAIDFVQALQRSKYVILNDQDEKLWKPDSGCQTLLAQLEKYLLNNTDPTDDEDENEDEPQIPSPSPTPAPTNIRKSEHTTQYPKEWYNYLNTLEKLERDLNELDHNTIEAKYDLHLLADKQQKFALLEYPIPDEPFIETAFEFVQIFFDKGPLPGRHPSSTNSATRNASPFRLKHK